MLESTDHPRAIHVLDDAAGVEAAAARRFVELGRAAIGARGCFNVALAGGSTPKGMYTRLARDYRDQLDWSRVRFFWGDERCVPSDDPQSNSGMAQRELLAPLVIDAVRIHPMEGGLEPELGARRYAQALEVLPRSSTGIPMFDLVLLGLGKDAHVASLFPGAARGLEPCPGVWVVTGVSPEGVRERLTVTLDVINAAAYVLFTVVGGEKTQALRKALATPRKDVPASLVAPTSGRVEWYVDVEARGDGQGELGA